MLDFFDFFIVGYLVAQFRPRWHLTYGRSSAMLLSAGVGAIVSALTRGALADAFGRGPHNTNRILTARPGGPASSAPPSARHAAGVRRARLTCHGESAMA